MIVTEYFKTRPDGVVLNRTYSDAGMMIERDGVQYNEAIDPAELNRQYVETNEPTGENNEVATYKAALNILGVQTEVVNDA